MALPNIDPIYSRLGSMSGIAVGGTALTRSDGSGTIGTDMSCLFTADPTNGSWVSRVRFSPSGVVAATATAATVLRVYVSSKSSGATRQGDTWLIQEVAAPAQTSDQTTTATNFLEVPLNFALPPGYSILASSHVVNAVNTSWTGICFGGVY